MEGYYKIPYIVTLKRVKSDKKILSPKEALREINKYKKINDEIYRMGDNHQDCGIIIPHNVFSYIEFLSVSFRSIDQLEKYKKLEELI